MPFSKKLLVVDDNPINRRILCKIVGDEYGTAEAGNGLEALRALEEDDGKIQLILLDLVMPEMDGYQFLEVIKSIPKYADIPVIVTTQKDGEEEEIRALGAGAADFLTKPYNPRIIRHRIHSIIRLRETCVLIGIVERDRLTGLYSKEFFYQKVEEEMILNSNQKYDIICLDIENFKLVNDMFGTRTGDDLLCHTARILKDRVGKGGICGRLGADTFAAFLSHRKDYADWMFQEASEQLNEFPIGISLVVNCGIFPVEDRSLPVNMMCDRALLAAASVKGHYGRYFAYYDDSFRQRLLQEQAILDSMEEALETEQFQVWYQPQYSLKNGLVTGAEALVRWNHPSRGILSPGVFIPLFEKNGFIARLDQYVWQRVCRDLRAWRGEGVPTVPVSVNISRMDIYNPRLRELILDLTRRYGVAPGDLHLEVTESAYTENPRQIIDAVSALKAEGFHIEMDDFGTGYSSLNMLAELPIDTLKLDMKFVQNEAVNRKSRYILGAIVGLAREMGLGVTAEGVETREQAERLRRIGCDCVQGYYFAKPMPGERFRELLIEEGSD